jgi:mono/diheme cytochrome c family protein
LYVYQKKAASTLRELRAHRAPARATRLVATGGRIQVSDNPSLIGNYQPIAPFLAGIAVLLVFLAAGCHVERRKSNAELGLNPQQAAGRAIYDAHCDRCHEPYSTEGKQGPGLKHLFRNQYLRESGLPANDDRVREIILYGRAKMPAFGQVLTDQQVQDLLVYLHTL